ncbi:MAG: sulfatase-like hydrolase/transferase [Deltaproteobacteria bacterium]|nr:sulfatase-like hydrolase/transferase [Deltaproteobacteria bacterium]
MRTYSSIFVLGLAALAFLSCSKESPTSTVPLGEAPKKAPKPSILLITLDTTRADALGLESGQATTPHLDALASRGVWFSRAQTTAPMTLPAHVSMLTGVYPDEHGIHENARYLGQERELLAERLKKAGYQTAAFVSGFPLSKQFGLARGFDHYDDLLEGEGGQGGNGAERTARETTQRALAHLESSEAGPLLLWVHYFDPHEPYSPPEPFRSRFSDHPYLGEIAYMDEQAGRLIEAFQSRQGSSPWRILVVGDHGEGLGEHGEVLHGNLLYQGVMRVPLILAGDGIVPGQRDHAVSTRRVFDTLSAWAGTGSERTLLSDEPEPVLGEAMKPFLQYGWQPQIMAVRDQIKVIRSGETEVYDLAADPAEEKNIVETADLHRDLREALRAYSIPSSDQEAGDEQALTQEDRDRLASLGYASGEGRAPVRANAPNPKDMTHLFRALDLGSGLFVHQQYDKAVPVFEKVLKADPENLMVTLRLAVASSVLGRRATAEQYFGAARKLHASSVDVMHYHGLHHLRGGNLGEAESLLKAVASRSPNRLPALAALAEIQERSGNPVGAEEWLQKVITLKRNPFRELVRLGDARMAQGKTLLAIDSYEQAQILESKNFERFLELGVLYLSNGQAERAGESLDRVAPDHPGYPMALFKRAQVSVLLGEADRRLRVQRARESADANTQRLIASEKLFSGYLD